MFLRATAPVIFLAVTHWVVIAAESTCQCKEESKDFPHGTVTLPQWVFLLVAAVAMLLLVSTFCYPCRSGGSQILPQASSYNGVIVEPYKKDQQDAATQTKLTASEVAHQGRSAVDALWMEKNQSHLKTVGVQVESQQVDVAVDAIATQHSASMQTDPLITVKLARDKQAPMDVVFLFDSSASVGEQDFSKAKDFVGGLVAELDMPSVRCGLIRFETACTVISGLEGDRETLLDALVAMKYSIGETKLARPLRAAAEMFRSSSRVGVTRAIVVVTDGDPNDEAEALRASEELRRAGIRLLFVAVGSHLRIPLLQDLSSAPATHNVFEVPSYDALRIDTQIAVLTSLLKVTQILYRARCNIEFMLANGFMVDDEGPLECDSDSIDRDDWPNAETWGLELLPPGWKLNGNSWCWDPGPDFVPLPYGPTVPWVPRKEPETFLLPPRAPVEDSVSPQPQLGKHPFVQGTALGPLVFQQSVECQCIQPSSEVEVQTGNSELIDAGVQPEFPPCSEVAIQVGTHTVDASTNPKQENIGTQANISVDSGVQAGAQMVEVCVGASVVLPTFEDAISQATVPLVDKATKVEHDLIARLDKAFQYPEAVTAACPGWSNTFRASIDPGTETPTQTSVAYATITRGAPTQTSLAYATMSCDNASQTVPPIWAELGRGPQRPMDVAFAIGCRLHLLRRDHSLYESGNFGPAKNFLRIVVNALDMPEIQVGLLRFDERCTLISELSGNKDFLLKRLDHMECSFGEANLSSTLQAGARLLKSRTRKVPKLLVILIDEEPQDLSVAAEYAQMLRDQGTRIVFVAVGMAAQSTSIPSLASWPSDRNVVRAASLESVEALASCLLERIVMVSAIVKRAKCTLPLWPHMEGDLEKVEGHELVLPDKPIVISEVPGDASWRSNMPHARTSAHDHENVPTSAECADLHDKRAVLDALNQALLRARAAEVAVEDMRRDAKVAVEDAWRDAEQKLQHQMVDLQQQLQQQIRQQQIQRELAFQQQQLQLQQQMLPQQLQKQLHQGSAAGLMTDQSSTAGPLPVVQQDLDKQDQDRQKTKKSEQPAVHQTRQMQQHAGSKSPSQIPNASMPPQLNGHHYNGVDVSSPIAESLEATVEDVSSRIGDDLLDNMVTPRISKHVARDMPALSDNIIFNGGYAHRLQPGTSPMISSLDTVPKTPTERRTIFDAQPRVASSTSHFGVPSPTSVNNAPGLVTAAAPAAHIEDPGENGNRTKNSKTSSASVSENSLRLQSPQEDRGSERIKKDMEIDLNALAALRTSILQRYGDFRLAFHKFDTSGSGHLTATEFSAGADVLGLDRSSSTQLFHALQSPTSRGKGFVTLEEWMYGLGPSLPGA